MKITSFNTFVTTSIIMSTAFFGVIAHAAQPSVVTAPATEISETSATLHAIYHSGNTQGV
ncbi:MAG: hypothetical protein LRY41_00220 [Candidatus Pacebacteria bacterium]|nr:hypothetical protein [Candidatus Paceibacterota bacterium]